MNTSKNFAVLVQNFFYDFLINQRHVSRETVKSYRDTFSLLLRFAEKKLNKLVSELCLRDLNADLIVKFLASLESDRGNTISTRNIRLAAIRSFFHYAAYQEPAELPTIQRVLAIPIKHHDHVLLGFLSKKEIAAILSAPNLNRWSGRRDQVLFTTMYNTGARVSEVIGVTRKDIDIQKTMVVHLHGKGRKERVVPLWKNTAILINSWLREINDDPRSPVFPNYAGKAMTRIGVGHRLKYCVKEASLNCQSLKNKKVSPHIIRHTTAMHLLQSGVDITVIALWLGHENINTTHKYMESDIDMKRKILMKIKSPSYKVKPKPMTDRLLKFLESL